MAWSSKTPATQITSFTTETDFDVDVQLQPGEVAHVQVNTVFPTPSTEDVLVAVYTTLDDTTEDWDTIPFIEKRFLADALADRTISFHVERVYKFKVSVRPAVSQSITSADTSFRRDTVDLSA